MVTLYQCKMCKKGELVQLSKKEISGATYFIMKCNNCNHEVAKRKD